MTGPCRRSCVRRGAVAHTYVDRLDDAIRIDGDDGHHLQRVRRLQPGERVTAADGYGRWRSYVDRGRGRRRRSISGRRRSSSTRRRSSRGSRSRVAHQGRPPGAGRPEAHRARRRPDRLRRGGALGRALGRAPGRRRASPGSLASRVRQGRSAAGPGCRWSTARSRPADLADHPGLVVADPAGVTADALAPPARGPGTHAPSGWSRSAPKVASPTRELERFGGAPRLAVGPFVLRAETAAIAAAAALAGPEGPQRRLARARCAADTT